MRSNDERASRFADMAMKATGGRGPSTGAEREAELNRPIYRYDPAFVAPAGAYGADLRSQIVENVVATCDAIIRPLLDTAAEMGMDLAVGPWIGERHPVHSDYTSRFGVRFETMLIERDAPAPAGWTAYRTGSRR